MLIDYKNSIRSCMSASFSVHLHDSMCTMLHIVLGVSLIWKKKESAIKRGNSKSQIAVQSHVYSNRASFWHMVQNISLPVGQAFVAWYHSVTHTHTTCSSTADKVNFNCSERWQTILLGARVQSVFRHFAPRDIYIKVNGVKTGPSPLSVWPIDYK